MMMYEGVFVDPNHSVIQKVSISRLIKDIQKLASNFIDELIHEFPNDIHVLKLKNWSGVIRELEYNENGILASNTNKGDFISICMIDKRGDLNTKNELIWVLLHELAHVMTDEYKHNSFFWKHNKFLVNQAIQKGIYTSNNYKKNPVQFCGDIISYNF